MNMDPEFQGYKINGCNLTILWGEKAFVIDMPKNERDIECVLPFKIEGMRQIVKAALAEVQGRLKNASPKFKPAQGPRGRSAEFTPLNLGPQRDTGFVPLQSGGRRPAVFKPLNLKKAPT